MSEHMLATKGSRYDWTVFQVIADDLEERGACPEVVAYMRHAEAICRLVAAAKLMLDEHEGETWSRYLIRNVYLALDDAGAAFDDYDAVKEVETRLLDIDKAVVALRALLILE